MGRESASRFGSAGGAASGEGTPYLARPEAIGQRFFCRDIDRTLEPCRSARSSGVAALLPIGVDPAGIVGILQGGRAPGRGSLSREGTHLQGRQDTGSSGNVSS